MEGEDQWRLEGLEGSWKVGLGRPVPSPTEVPLLVSTAVLNLEVKRPMWVAQDHRENTDVYITIHNRRKINSYEVATRIIVWWGVATA